MRRPSGITLVGAAAAAFATAGAVGAPEATGHPVARLLTPPGALVAGRSWVAQLVIRPAPAHTPALLARDGKRTTVFRMRRVGRGRFAARVRLPAGRWTIAARLGQHIVRAGGILVRPRAPAPYRIATPALAALDGAGRLIVVEDGRNRVLRVDVSTGRAEVVAGRGTVLADGDGGPARAAGLGDPFGVAAHDRVIYASSVDALRRIDEAGRIATVARVPGQPVGPVAVAPDGTPWFWARDGHLHRVDARTGEVTVAGGDGREGFGGDGGSVDAATFAGPHGLTFASDGALIVSDTGNGRVRRIDATTRVVTTIASGLEGPFDVEAAANGSVFVAENAGNRVLRVNRTGAVSVFAGTGAAGSSGDGGPAAAAVVGGPVGLALDDAQGTLYVVEVGGRIRRVDLATGAITGVAVRM